MRHALYAGSLAVLLAACHQQSANLRNARPANNESGGTIPNYLDEQQRDVRGGQAASIEFDRARIDLPDGWTSSDTRIRMTRTRSIPQDHNLGAELKAPVSDIVDIEFVDLQTGVILSRDSMDMGYTLSLSAAVPPPGFEFGSVMLRKKPSTTTANSLELEAFEVVVLRSDDLVVSPSTTDPNLVWVTTASAEPRAIYWMIHLPIRDEDTTAPSAPTTLTLVTPASSPANVQTPTIRVAGAEPGAGVRLYSDSSCSTPLSASVSAGGATVDITTQPLTETTYTIYANQTDAAGNSSDCSATSLGYQYDATAPAAASPLSWSQSSPHSGTSVTAAWTRSNASDLANQKIQFFTGSSCNTESGTLIDLSSASVQTRAFTGTDGTTYTYKITSFDAAGNSTVSGCSSILTIDTTAPAAATSLSWSESTPSSVTSVTAAWTKSLASDLSNQTIQFYADGSCTSASGSSIDLGSSSTQTRSFTGANGTYTYKITSFDNAGNSSESACSSAMEINVLTCPANWVKIPANTDLGTAEFCVMKYEAKNVSSVATSQASGTPWVDIARGIDATTAGSAWKACKDLGANYDLLTNAQWQAIARNIEGVSSNWSGGNSSGSNSLNRGNSDQYSALAADASDSNGCIGITSNGDPADNCGSAWHVNKRTHTLSNGEVIWDIAGNVWEWVQDNLTDQGSNNHVSQLTSGAGYNMLRWGPAGNYTSKNSGEYGGLGYGYLNYSGGAVVRGGDWNDSTSAGVFASDLFYEPTEEHTFNNVGFRCALAGGS